jgi:glycoside/pentoside/hexuronide:cation symporter, GPH family
MTQQGAGRQLSFGTMVWYGFGQIGERLRLSGFGLFLLFYYQQIVGLSGTLTAIALAITGVFDALSDPILGALSDRTRTRWGRRHPFMIIGMVPLAVGFYATFTPPEMSDMGTFFWLLGWSLVARIGTSLYHVSHMALGAEMARGYAQRSTLYSFNVFFESMATAAGPALAYLFFFPTTEKFSPGLLNAEGYRGFALAFSLAMVVAIGLSAFGTRREIAHLPQHTSLHSFSLGRVFSDVRDVFRNRSFRALFVGMLLASLALTLETTLSPYMGTHFWRFTTEQLALVPTMTLVGLCIAMPLLPVVTRRFDKRRTLIASVVISVISLHILIALRLISPAWFPDHASTWLLPLYLSTYLVAAVMTPLIYATATSMFADIADEHELETGERREGVIFAARSLALGLVQSVSITLTGVLLDLIAFPTGARAGTVSDDVIWKLGMIPMAAAVLHAIGAYLYRGYRLDRNRHAEIVAELMRRRSEAADRAKALAESGDAAAPESPSTRAALSG